MKLFFDKNRSLLTSTVGGNSVPPILLTFREKRSIQLVFLEDRVTVSLPRTDAEISIGVRIAPGGDLMAFTDQWSYNAKDKIYDGVLDLNTEEVQEALGEEDKIQAFIQVRLLIGDEVDQYSQWVPVTIQAALVGEGDIPPSVIPDPEEWLSGKAVRYDEAQSLSEGELTQALENLNLENVDNTADASKTFTASQISDRGAVGEEVLKSGFAFQARAALELGTAATKDTSTGGNGSADSGKVLACDSEGNLTPSGLVVNVGFEYSTIGDFDESGFPKVCVTNPNGAAYLQGDGIDFLGPSSTYFRRGNADGETVTLPDYGGKLANKARESFTVSTLPSASARPREDIWVSDYSGGARPAYSDGSTWQYYQPVIEVEPP